MDCEGVNLAGWRAAVHARKMLGNEQLDVCTREVILLNGYAHCGLHERPNCQFRLEIVPRFQPTCRNVLTI